jgi:hypothetical protein
MLMAGVENRELAEMKRNEKRSSGEKRGRNRTDPFDPTAAAAATARSTLHSESP